MIDFWQTHRGFCEKIASFGSPRLNHHVSCLQAVSAGGAGRPAFDPSIITSIYHKELHGGKRVDPSRLVLLELTGFLENYLLPNFDAATASFEHVMCIILVRNGIYIDVFS